VSARRNQLRAYRAGLVLLAVTTAVLGTTLWRIYPEYRRLKEQKPVRAAAVVQPDQLEVSKPLVAQLYFARVVEGKQRMVAMPRELPSGLGVARTALEELLRGEVPRGCERPLPPGTEVRGISIEGGVATLDFSEELREGFRGGSDNEQVTVYSIVNTLTSLPTIERVRILVEGRSINTLGGHHDLSGPLAFDDELVVPHP
jgi:germination protein M